MDRASGLKINLEKSAMIFSKNVTPTSREHLAAILGVKVEERHAKYVGLPTIVSRSKRKVFDGIKDRIWSKMQGWVAKKRSQAGRVVLIKAVLAALPIILMSCFRFLDSLRHEIEGMFANFFWHFSLECKIH
ncbi:UNVERIFIED_CONTAM: hypothetical protein Slati_0921000 [Sesamum latifolium]|uniref:Reverse transcriptase n=1 Tax=Sesamum latifolium TaxID=2727402 RepID=A0AAW2XNU0_9LAMI